MEKLIDGKLCVLTESSRKHDPCYDCCFWSDTCETKDRECMTDENEFKSWRVKDE